MVACAVQSSMFKLSIIKLINIFPLNIMFFRDNGVKAIENLMKKKGRFDYILLETTGLADPGMNTLSDTSN